MHRQRSTHQKLGLVLPQRLRKLIKFIHQIRATNGIGLPRKLFATLSSLADKFHMPHLMKPVTSVSSVHEDGRAYRKATLLGARQKGRTRLMISGASNTNNEVRYFPHL
jgi:hypothetical protein